MNFAINIRTRSSNVTDERSNLILCNLKDVFKKYLFETVCLYVSR